MSLERKKGVAKGYIRMSVAFPKEGLQEAKAGNAGVGVTPPKSG